MTTILLEGKPNYNCMSTLLLMFMGSLLSLYEYKQNLVTPSLKYYFESRHNYKTTRESLFNIA